MRDLASLPNEEFRARFRAWLAVNYPHEWRQDMRRPFRRLRGADYKRWLGMLYAAGWRGIAWPKEYGGHGLDFTKQLIFHEELELVSAARVVDTAETQLGPTLIIYGTEEQKKAYLSKILSGEHVWAQGYSEPNAGSDLASLRMQADLVGDHFVVNGQKIWTTAATDATHIFVLVRTDKMAKKQAGISFLLSEITAPGITVRPIINLVGEDEFCEVFFDNVRIPVENLVGGLNQGWTVAKALLGYERVFIGSPALAGKALELAERLVEERGLGSDTGVADRLAALAADLHDYRLLYAEKCDTLVEGGAPGPEFSVLKLFVTELLQRLTEFNQDIAGSGGAIVGDVLIGGTVTDLHWQNMMSRPPTIFAGANEVQRDIVAKAVLGLPSVRRSS